jgi:hypothetical protein
LRALGLFARRPLTGCSPRPRCLIFASLGWVTTRLNLMQILGFAPWREVRFGSKPEVQPFARHVRSTLKSRLHPANPACPKRAISRLMHRSNEGLLDHLVGVGERCGTLRPIERSHGLMLINNSCGRRDNFRTSGGLQEVTSMLFRNTASSTATSSHGKTDARGRSASTGMQP